MKKRDLDILNDLQRFRCLTRDHIINLHFRHLKQPVTSCNTVLKRLRRDGYIEVNTNYQQYLYFCSPSPIKKDSTKIPHFLKIADFYISLLKYQKPKTFIVEPKYGKGYMEPDAFTIFRRAPFFIEIQRSVYSDKVMKEKVKRYEEYYFSEEWLSEPWQNEKNKIFPKIIMITDTRYSIESEHITFIQVPSIEELISLYPPKPIMKVNPTKVTLQSSVN